MIIYRDILTGDEIISDAYDLKPGPVEGIWEADAKKISIGGESFDTGANASAEGEDADDTEDSAQQVIDVVHSFRLQPNTGLTKKLATADLKKYFKAVNNKLKEDGKTAQAEQFQKTAPAVLKHILANFDDYDVFSGETMGGEEASPHMWVFVNYREDGVTPFVSIIQHALEEYKV